MNYTSFSLCIGITLHAKFTGVDSYHDKEQWDKYRSENNSYKTKHIHANDNSKNCDERMNVTQLFCQPESENIIHTANNAEPEPQCNKSSDIITTGK